MLKRTASFLVFLAATAAWGATPPSQVNYQGILRNAGGTPLSGTFDMVFTFYDDPTAGNQILIASHTQFPLLKSVTVTNGLLNVALGSAGVADGSGPGTYTSLDQMFRDYGAVWMEIQVGPVGLARDTLAPRIRLVSSAYALNTGRLAGQPAGNFIDGSGSTQTKAGALVAQGGLTGNSNSAFGVFGNGGTSGGAFQALSGISFAYAGYAGAGHYGIRAQGGDAGGFFRDADNLGTSYLALTDLGMQGSGAIGGIFSSTGHTGYAELASGHNGIYAAGNNGGGELDDPMTGTAGTLATQFGLSASGRYCSPACGAGGHFANTPSSGRAYAALGETGLWAAGSAIGGEFQNATGSGHAKLAAGSFGVVGEGRKGIEGNGGGGSFQDPVEYGTAYLGYGSYGVWASGAVAGAFLSDVVAFQGNETTAAEGADGFHSVVDAQTDVAGKFYRVEPGTGLQSPDVGVAYYGGSSYTISGAGLKSFVQNDPAEPGKQIVFTALEGDEAGTYTRGTGRIVQGEARVMLSPAFAAATNPDIGLTALVTPRAGGVPLAVASLSSQEIVVRAGGPEVDGVVFDFAVYGLRLGFEEHVTVQPKTNEATLPPDGSGPPDPASALARFAAMRGPAGDASPLDLTRAARLKEMVRQAGARRTGSAPAPDAGGGPVPGLSAPVPVATPLSTGDVAAFTTVPEVPGRLLAPATTAPGEIVAGIVGGSDPDEVHAVAAPLALGGSIALCRADASFGAIRVGDLLGASPTPGRARLAAGAGGGAVIAKALEPLAESVGLIRVLVMSR